MRRIDTIVVHCSDSGWGDAAVIDGWHKARGWSGIGYHLVVLNGYRRSGQFDPDEIGLVEEGRSEEQVGAHVQDHNAHSLGICYIGNAAHPAAPVQYEVLVERVVAWCDRYGLTDENVYGHTELDSSKTCPDLDMDQFRADVRARLEGEW